MSTENLHEIIGYVGSVLVAVSLMMSSLIRLRVINLLGAITFSVYGLLIGALPVALVNLFIVGINVYHLRQIAFTREYFRLLEVAPDSDYLRAFLDFYAADVQRTHPGFDYDPTGQPIIVFILRDMVPAGLFIGRVVEPGVVRAELDFAIPRFRDFRMGRYLFEERRELFPYPPHPPHRHPSGRRRAPQVPEAHALRARGRGSALGPRTGLSTDAPEHGPPAEAGPQENDSQPQSLVPLDFPVRVLHLSRAGPQQEPAPGEKPMANPQREPTGASSVVGSCTATDCVHNEDQECHAGAIQVRIEGRGAVCGTYDPEKPKPRP